MVDFTRYHSIDRLLGFHSELYTISGSYVNGSTQPTMYSFFPDIFPGNKIIENPHNLLYLPITSDTIHSSTVWLTDQNGNELNLRGETLSIRFHLRERFKKYHELKNDKSHQY